MPSVEHEAVVELLHRNPQLTVALLAGCGVRVPEGADAVIADSNLSARKPVALTAEMVIVLTATVAKLAIVIEVQKYPPKQTKRRAWPAYVSIAQVQHACDAILVVIALRTDTARASRKLIRTGHPGFDLAPLVIGPGNTPDPASPRYAPAIVELTVLAALTGALDLADPKAQAFILQTLTRTDPDRRAAYTGLILTIASEEDQLALEDLMRTMRRDNLADRLLAEGQAQGQAEMLIRILAVRGFALTDDIRQRVTSCADTSQLEAWAALAITAGTLDEVFDSQIPPD